MDQIDPAQAQRVWQRVRGNQEENLQQLLAALVRTNGEDAALYQQMAPKNSGWNRLLEEKRSQIGTLRGLYFIHAGQKLPPVKLPAPQGDPDRLVRACMGRQMQLLRTYDQQSKSEEFGCIFASLHDAQREHCRLLLETIGRR